MLAILNNNNIVNLSNGEKWGVSAYLAVLFLIIACPLVFALVNKLTAPLGLNIVNQNGAPNMIGLVLHALVFLLLVRLSMMAVGKKSAPTPTASN